jgi:tetratricopeptide (TPR) repeat protein/transglutaminase-like putative cysteine protease
MSSKQWFAALLLLGVSFLPGRAQEAPQAKVTEKPLSAPSDFSKEAYVIERIVTRVSAEADGSGVREISAEVRMLANAGVKGFAVLNFTYTSANEVVEIDYVRVRKPDGSIVKTPDYNIQDMPGEVTRTAPLYSDIHEKHVAVKGLGVGDVLEYQVRYRVIKPEVPGHFWQEYSFTKHAIARDEQLEISVPASKYVKVASPEFKPDIKEEAGRRRVYRWTRANLIVKEKDPDEIPRRIPPNPDVQVTTFANWEEVGNWYGGLQKTQLDVTPAIQSKANELTKGLKTDDEKIRAFYKFVSLKYHYIGLDFGIGRYQPHAADDVLDNGYGDCKDKHTLLATLLKAAGIEAWPALIHASRKLDPDVPSPAQFNHVITVVPRGGENIWLDTTPEVSPYGLLLMVLRNKQALVIPAQKPPLLMTTPANPPFPQQQEFSMSGKLSGSGRFSGHVEQSYRGDTEVLLRGAFRQVPESQWTNVVQRFSYGLNFGGDVSNVKVTPPDDIDKPFEISYDYVRKKYGDWDNRQVIAPLPPMGIELAKGAKEQKLTEPLPLGALGKVIYRSRLELPEGYTVTAPAKVHLKQPYAEYTSVTNVADGTMTTNRELVISKNEVALSEWEGFKKFGRAVYDDEFNFLHLAGAGPDIKIGDVSGPNIKVDGEDPGMALDEMFQEGTSAGQRRDFRSAQDWFRKVIAKDPKYHGAHFGLGSALAMQGQLDAALTEFRKEQEISPQDERAYEVPAMFLEQMGKKDEAITEWRNLLKADPSNQKAAATLGSLLLGSEKYNDAIEVFEAAAKQAPDNAGLELALGESYLKVGNKEQAVAHIKAGIEKKGDDAMLLNNAAYTLAEGKVSLDLAQQYAEKSLAKLEEEAKRPNSSDELPRTYKFSLVWDTVGWVYFQQGDLNKAESFVQAAWLLSQDSLVGEHLGDIYQKMGKKTEAAHTYKLALAATSSTQGISPTDRVKMYQERSEELNKRYQKLMGAKPVNDIRRLPNGQWTLTTDEQLQQLREVKFDNAGKLSGSAEFIISFKPAEIDSIDYTHGDEKLKVLEEKLKLLHFQLAFPPNSSAILVRRAQVECRSASSCTAKLVKPDQALSTGPALYPRVAAQ